MSAASDSIWHSTKISDRLALLWEQGLFASDIAEDLSRTFGIAVTKNAVVSRRKRIPGLKARPAAIGRSVLPEEWVAKAVRVRVEKRKQKHPVSSGSSTVQLRSVIQPAVPIVVRASAAPIERAAPGTVLAPVGRLWHEIVDLAERDGWFDFRKDNLPAYNRSRIAHGVAPLAIDRRA